MNLYLKKTLDLINNGSMDNTYKMSWIRSIVETCEKNPKKKIHFNDLSKLIFKYYWNQCIFFNLNQSHNRKKKPEIIQIVEKSIEDYQSLKRSQKKITFLKVEKDIKIPVTKISSVLKKDVCERFLNLGNQTYKIYDYDLTKREIVVFKPEVLKTYSDILYNAINYRWTQELETMDGSPRISKKIKGVDRDQLPRRGNLRKFREFIEIENPKRKCFLTGKLISGIPSIDHVIPWSYMYSDDLWNLVYVLPKENSSKSNRTPNKELIEKLKRRNIKLLKSMKKKGIYNKLTEELELAIKNDFVDKFWIGCKG
tara:strand:+ start:519 stop:1451 length:933 start_codon:yes stop_codon:yes gene_type:complete